MKRDMDMKLTHNSPAATIKGFLVCCDRLMDALCVAITESPKGGVNVTPDYLDTLRITETSTTLSTVTAIYDIGSFFGALLAVWYGEKFGRKKTILTGSALMTVGMRPACFWHFDGYRPGLIAHKVPYCKPLLLAWLR